MKDKISLTKYFAVICAVLLAITAPCSANAKELEGTGRAVVFLLDVSGSMKTNDPNRYAIDSIAQFIVNALNNCVICS